MRRKFLSDMDALIAGELPNKLSVIEMNALSRLGKVVVEERDHRTDIMPPKRVDEKLYRYSSGFYKLVHK
tara:strand:+ start:615 stop:824 length:210 start_codon:yes stop_codon:yes gene_type:complete